MARYHGSCHRGAVRFAVDAEIGRVTVCNCSICAKKGVLHHRVTAESFHLLAGAEVLATYQFGTMVAKHHYCPRCGSNGVCAATRRAAPVYRQRALPG